MVDRKGVYYEPVSNPPPGAITFIKAVPIRSIRAGLYRQGAYCTLVYRPSPAGVVAERAEYAAWRMGLEILAGGLQGRPSAIPVLTPAAARPPRAGPTHPPPPPPGLFKAPPHSPPPPPPPAHAAPPPQRPHR